MLRSNGAAILFSALLIVQGAAFYGFARRTEMVPVSKPLAAFPTTIGDWRMVREGAIEQDERDVLRADDYLTREYRTPAGKSASLFVAYFRSQRAGQTPHSPKNCLPGSGWSWSVADTIDCEHRRAIAAHRDQSLRCFERRQPRGGAVLVSIARPRGGERISCGGVHRF